MVYFVFTGKSTLSRERDVIFTQDGSFLAITPFQCLLESRYCHGRKRFPFLIGWADCKPRPVKLPKSFVKPPFYFPCISIISISPSHKRRENNLWQHKRKHGSGGVMRRCRRVSQTFLYQGHLTNKKTLADHLTPQISKITSFF